MNNTTVNCILMRLRISDNKFYLKEIIFSSFFSKIKQDLKRIIVNKEKSFPCSIKKIIAFLIKRLIFKKIKEFFFLFSISFIFFIENMKLTCKLKVCV